MCAPTRRQPVEPELVSHPSTELLIREMDRAIENWHDPQAQRRLATIIRQKEAELQDRCE